MTNNNKSELKSLFLYLIVGGIATVVEWVLFAVLCNILQLHYIIATVIAYLISTFCNWAAGRLLVFNKSHLGIVKEIASVYITSIGGLLLNIAIMYILVEWLSMPEMISKITATILVFAYNYIIKKTFDL